MTTNQTALALASGVVGGIGTGFGVWFGLSWLAGQNPRKFQHTPPLSPPDPILDQVATTLTIPKVVDDPQDTRRPRPHRSR